MKTVHGVQFLDKLTNRIITSSPYAHQDANEVRAWTATGELVVAVSRSYLYYPGETTSDSGWTEYFWSISGSDMLPDWTNQAEQEFSSWRDAMEYALAAMEIPVTELDNVL